MHHADSFGCMWKQPQSPSFEWWSTGVEMLAIGTCCTLLVLFLQCCSSVLLLRYSIRRTWQATRQDDKTYHWTTLWITPFISRVKSDLPTFCVQHTYDRTSISKWFKNVMHHSDSFGCMWKQPQSPSFEWWSTGVEILAIGTCCSLLVVFLQCCSSVFLLP